MDVNNLNYDSTYVCSDSRQKWHTAFGLQSAREGVAAVEWSVTDTGLRSLDEWRQTVAELQLVVDVDELVDALANQVILPSTTHWYAGCK